MNTKKTALTTKKAAALLTVSVVTALTMPVCAAAEEAVDTRDVVVTASRTAQDIKETPSAVQVITREDLDKIGAHNLGDALKMATSIEVGGGAMAGRNVSIRGMSKRHVLILVDGKRLTSEGGYMMANAYELDRINMDNVERIEIVRGPVSALYGSEGMGGVVNIITRKSKQQELTFSLSPQRYTDKSSIGSDNYFVRYDSGQQDKWSWIVSADRTDTDAYYNNTGTSKNQFGSRENFNLDVTYDLNDNQHLDFSANLLREDLKGRTTDPKTLQLRNDRYDNRREQYSLGLRGETQRGNYEIRTYYGEHDKNERNYLTSNGAISDFDVSKRKSWVFEGHSTTQLNDNHLLTVGGEFRNETYRGTRVGTGKKVFDKTYGALTKQGSEADINYSAFYVQDEWMINDRLLVIPSLRYDDSDKFSGNISPKLGMTYKMSDHSRVKFNVGKGFKAPTLDDMYMRMVKPMGTFVVDVTGNPDLQPEKSTSYELSLEGEKGKNFGKITYFVNDVKNLIRTKTTVGFVPGVGMYATSTYLNEDRADIDGIELEAGRYLTDKLTLKLNYTYLDATGTAGERLEDRAKHAGTIQLLYDDTANSGISAAFWNEWKKDYLFASTTSSTNINKTYSLWNVGVTKKWNDNFSSYIGLDNIFNKKIDELNILGATIRAGMTFKI